MPSIQDLDSRFPIVNPDGTPTDYFMRMLRDRGETAEDTVDSLEEVIQELPNKADKSTVLTAGTGLSGGGDLSADRTFDLENTAVTPGSYTNTNLTVDAQGRITAAANGSGGGGSAAWTLIGQNGSAPSAQTVTITIASPGVVTLNSHGFGADMPLVFSTTGALPTGLTAGTTYFVRNPTANTFEVSATAGGASINTSGSQSGVHSVTRKSTWTFTTNVANVDVTGLAAWNELLIFVRSVSASVSGGRFIAVSIDNGASFYTASGDYSAIDANGAGTNSAAILTHSTATTLGRNIIGEINLKGAQKMGRSMDGVLTRIFLASPEDINAIRLANTSGNLTGGSLFVYAR